MASKPKTDKSNIVLPSKARKAPLTPNGTKPGSKYGYGAGKKAGK